jgi:hypothetical protein
VITTQPKSVSEGQRDEVTQAFSNDEEVRNNPRSEKADHYSQHVPTRL